MAFGTDVDGEREREYGFFFLALLRSLSCFYIIIFFFIGHNFLLAMKIFSF